jgi:hypothetical protein
MTPGLEKAALQQQHSDRGFLCVSDQFDVPCRQLPLTDVAGNVGASGTRHCDPRQNRATDVCDQRRAIQ